MVTVETLIVGAGPAGTAAATTLALEGHEVLVVDRAEFPRDKCCGDGLTTMALRELESLGWEPASSRDYTVVSEISVRSPSGRVVELSLPDSGHYAAVVPRAELDRSLVDLARHAGARILEGHSIDAIDIVDGHAVADFLGLGKVEARTVIAADGMWSPTRKLLGLQQERYLGDWHGFRQYFSDVGPDADRLWVWFEPDLLPGYVWSFPLAGGRANVGFGILRDAGLRVQEMRSLWPELLDRPHIRSVLGNDATPEDAHKAWPIPARVGELPLSHGPVLFVGDAAAATDPLTGEGIGQALLTGRLAAETALTTRHVETMAKRYEQTVRHHLQADHHLASILGRLLTHAPTARAAIRAAGASPWTRRNFARWMFEDYPRAVLATPHRWKQHRSARTGAFDDLGADSGSV